MDEEDDKSMDDEKVKLEILIDLGSTFSCHHVYKMASRMDNRINESKIVGFVTVTKI